MEDEKALRRPPTKEDAAFWADLSYMLVDKIVCQCGYVNKVQQEWHTGYFRAECEGCFEELDLLNILHIPDRTALLIQMIIEDKEPKHDIARLGERLDAPVSISPDVKREIDNYLKLLETEDKKREEEARSKSSCDFIDWDELIGQDVKDVKYEPKEEE